MGPARGMRIALGPSDPEEDRFDNLGPEGPHRWGKVPNWLLHSMYEERWEGHPSIPERVFSPTEYLPSPIRKVPRFQNAGKLSRATKIESFEATKPPNTKVLSMSTRFATWFNSAFANSNPLCKRKAIQASREAASVILMKAQQGGDHPPELSNPGQPRTKPP